MQPLFTPAAPGAQRWTAALAVLSLAPAISPRPRVNDLPVTPSDRPADPGRDADLARLLQAAAQGDTTAFEGFYNLTVGCARAVVRRIAGDNHTEDVLSDAYFQAWREAHRFEPARGSALAWLLTLARSRALDRLRAESIRHGGLSGAPEADEAALEDGSVPGPDTLLDRLQTTSHLHAALCDLSSSERWVLSLAYYRDHSHSEIAALTDLPLGTVKSLIHRSQQKLRAALDSHSVPAALAGTPRS